MSIEEKISNLLKEAIEDCEVHILDPRRDGKHLEAIIIASKFSGQSTLQRHQTVMDCLFEEFSQGLHALSIKTFTPQEWAEQKNTLE